MSAPTTLPLTLKPSRTKSVMLLIVCIVFVAIGVWMIRDGESMGYLCAIFFGLGVPVFVINLHPRASYLKLDETGFIFCSLFRAHAVRWADVEEFGIVSIRMNRMVAWNFFPGRASGGLRAMSKAISGFDAALPDTYGMGAPALADLMSTVHAQFREPVPTVPGAFKPEFDTAQ
jgi:hypothetical protein